MGYDDLPRTFALLRYAGELGEAHGQTLWNLTRDWSAGPRAASLETRVATSGVADPTSTSIIDEDTHQQYRAALDRLSRDAAFIRDLLTGMVTTERPPNPEDLWCRNHLRIGINEPRTRGDLCRRCDAIRRDPRFAGNLPGPKLMAHWDKHPRTPDTVVTDLMAEEREHTTKVRRVDSAVARARKPVPTRKKRR